MGCGRSVVMWKLIYILGNILSFPFFKWVVRFIAFIIGIGYYLFSPSRARRSRDFYKILFPEKTRLHCLYYSLKQYLNFTRVFIDRFIQKDYTQTSWSADGWEFLQEAMSHKRGGIILMSHVGNWDAAAHLLKGEGASLMIYMGEREKEHLEMQFKNKLKDKGIIIETLQEGENSPFKIIEGINFLRDGGFIAITGDRIWRQDQRTVKVKFLNRWILLSEIPHLMALMSEKPLYIFSSRKLKNNKFHFTSTEPYFVTAENRKERRVAIEKSVNNYSRELESMVRRNPFEWYHFEPFFIEDQEQG